MPGNEVKAKSVRKPLREVSNSYGGRSAKPSNTNKQNDNKGISMGVEEDNSLDRLLLIQSDLSSLINQIDELVVQAFKLKETRNDKKKEIEAFSNVLSNMLSSLKPWVPRFQRALSMPVEESKSQSGPPMITEPVSPHESNVGDIPEETKLGSLISPSPLVSWRADCTIERGRQLFMLTPLPILKSLSSKDQEPSESAFEGMDTSKSMVLPSTLSLLHGFANGNDDLVEVAAVKSTPIKPSNSAALEKTKAQNQGRRDISLPPSAIADSSFLVMTPCFKMSPPKSCVLLEPGFESSQLAKNKVYKSTPFPVGIHCRGSATSESSSSGASHGLALKYPELLGIIGAGKPCIGKKVVDTSAEWFISPPKTCVLLEPPDEKSPENAAKDSHVSRNDAGFNLQPMQAKDGAQKSHDEIQSTSGNRGHFCGNLADIESTPMWSEPLSTLRGVKHLGENTLKKELWTKFEAATGSLQFNVSTHKQSTQKGFLDLLEEASCDEES